MASSSPHLHETLYLDFIFSDSLTSSNPAFTIEKPCWNDSCGLVLTKPSTSLLVSPPGRAESGSLKACSLIGTRAWGLGLSSRSRMVLKFSLRVPSVTLPRPRQHMVVRGVGIFVWMKRCQWCGLPVVTEIPPCPWVAAEWVRRKAPANQIGRGRSKSFRMYWSSQRSR